MNPRTAIPFAGLIVLAIVNGILWHQAQVPAEAFRTLEALTTRADVRAAAISAPVVDLKRLDAQWVSESKARNTGPLIASVMENSLSKSLTALRFASRGHIDQIMVIDARGALIGADHPTHDFDQSDEAKWQSTVGSHTTKPQVEGIDDAPRGKIDQIAQSITSADGTIIGAVLLRWCRSDGGCSN
jgi:hypothetical protein